MIEIIRKDKEIVREIEYTDENERFDLIRLEPELRYDADWEDDYDTFNSSSYERYRDFTSKGQLHFILQLMSIQSYYEILAKLVELGYKNRIIFRDEESITKYKWSRKKSERHNFNVSELREYLEAHTWSSDLEVVVDYEAIEIKMRVDYNKLEKFRKDIKTICSDLHYKVVNWVNSKPAPYLKPEKYIVK